MCKITNKIKFCTCKVTSTERLKHYWALHRRNKDKNDILMGLPHMPNDWKELDFETNKIILENRLNEGDVFDVSLVFKAKDQLEIVFNNHDYEKRLVYGFKYLKGKWNIFETDDFYLMGFCDEVAFGKIKTGGSLYR
jgi:hypothetical protein